MPEKVKVFVACAQHLAGQMICRLIDSNQFTGEFHESGRSALNAAVLTRGLILVVGYPFDFEDERKAVVSSAEAGRCRVVFLTEEELLAKQMVSFELIDFLRRAEATLGKGPEILADFLEGKDPDGDDFEELDFEALYRGLVADGIIDPKNRKGLLQRVLESRRAAQKKDKPGEPRA